MKVMNRASLTFAGIGPEEAEAQLGLAAVKLARLLDGFRESVDGKRNLSDRIGEVAEVLTVAAACVAGMDPASRGDGLVGEGDGVVLVAHADPSDGVGGVSS
jgi:hypothetical protein